MYDVKLINKGKVVEQFKCHESLLKLLSFYEELGYQMDISKAQ